MSQLSDLGQVTESYKNLSWLTSDMKTKTPAPLKKAVYFPHTWVSVRASRNVRLVDILVGF